MSWKREGDGVTMLIEKRSYRTGCVAFGLSGPCGGF